MSFARRAQLAAGVLLAVCLAVGATRMGRGTVSRALDSLAQAQPGWLLVAATASGVALLCSAAAWRTGLRACGGSGGYTQVSARYAVGSLINAIAPAHVGGAVRLGLLSQTLSDSNRIWRVGGVCAAIAAVRGLVLAVLIVLAAAWGRIPFWLGPILAAGVLSAVLVCAVIARRADGRLGSLLEVFRSFAQSPREATGLVGYVVVSCTARLTAAGATAVALGVGRPVWVALLLVAAIGLAGVLPLTPGNIGAGAGAATVALHATGVSIGASLATGVAFQAVETLAAMTLGLAGTAVLTSPESRVRRWSLAATATVVVIAAGALGIVSVDLF